MIIELVLNYTCGLTILFTNLAFLFAWRGCVCSLQEEEKTQWFKLNWMLCWWILFLSRWQVFSVDTYCVQSLHSVYVWVDVNRKSDSIFLSWLALEHQPLSWQSTFLTTGSSCTAVFVTFNTLGNCFSFWSFHWSGFMLGCNSMKYWAQGWWSVGR